MFYSRLLLMLLLSATVMGQTRIISHVTRNGGGFETQVFIENRGIDESTYRLMPYTAAGERVTITEDGIETEYTLEGSLEGGTSTNLRALELNGNQETSHFLIEGEDIRVTAAYETVTGQGSPAHVRESDGDGTRYRLFAGDWERVFDGFAAVNMGSQATDVWVAQRDESGRITAVTRAVAGLEPMAKGLYVIGDPNGSEFDLANGGIFEIYADQKLAITALRGDIPGSSFLWVNALDKTGEASTTRDDRGVWNIEDGSLYDVMEAMGYAVAQDRLWQLETFRRQGLGRLAEIPFSGSTAVDQDRFARTVGYTSEEYAEAYAAMPADHRIAIQAYVDGINRHIAEAGAVPELMPGEFTFLSQFIGPNDVPLLPIETWTVEHLLALSVSLSRGFDPHGYGGGQLQNAAILQSLTDTHGQALGSQMFSDLRWANDPDALTMVPSEPVMEPVGQRTKGQLLGDLREDIDFKALADKLNGAREERIAFLESINARLKMGSFAWAVHGDRTDTGEALLYAGPQMGFLAPSLVVEGAINGGGLNVSGMTLPGVPAIIIGRTPNHAWSMQVGHAHTYDLYFEPPSALGAPHRSETINVAGGDSQTLEIYRTDHGPVLNQSPILAWKYAHWLNELNMMGVFLDLNRATDADSFGAALEDLGLSQHFLYADKDGDIAYWMSGRDPIRPAGEYRLPQGSLAGIPVAEYDIDVVRELVHDRNPARGYYGGWNNKASADYDNTPTGSSNVFGPSHRAQVIDDALRTLTARGNITFEEVRDLAIDISATYYFARSCAPWPFQVTDDCFQGTGGGNPWPFVADAFTAIVEANPSEDRSAALAILLAWDGHFVDGGEVRWISGTDRADGWMLMDAWVRRVMELTFEEVDDIGSLAAYNVLVHGLGDSSLTNLYDWFTNADETAPQTAEAIILQALDESIEALGTRPWGTDQRGTIDFFHALYGTLTNGTPIHSTRYGARATYAQVVSMGEDGPSRIQSMFPLGQSGFLQVGPDGAPILGEHVLDMNEFFDSFVHRTIQLFQ